jgi:hypothetical protein
MKQNKSIIMKAKSFLIALLVLVSAAAFANGPGPRVVVLNQKNSGTFKVIYEGEKVGNVKMTILNKQGVVVFKETTHNVDGFIRPVNFTGMEPGEYTIEIADASGKQIQSVVYTNETSVKSVQVSKIKEEGKYLLAVANDGSEQINVRIFDGANNLVHNQDLTINGNFGLVYNLKDVSGVPTFEVTDKTGAIRTIKY